MQFQNPDEIPEDHPIRKLLELQKKKEILQKKLDAQSHESSEDADLNILMPLWQVLGDTAETYWLSMLGIHAFVEAKDFIDELISKTSPLTIGVILEAISKHCMHMKEVTSKINKTYEEHFPEN